LKEPEMDGFRIPQNSSFQHFPTMCQPFQYLSDLGFLHDLLRTPLFQAAMIARRRRSWAMPWGAERRTPGWSQRFYWWSIRWFGDV
jgi:hypothetical protein